MARKIADELEMRRKPALAQNTKAIAADRKHSALLDRMMSIEGEDVTLFRNAAAIDHRLAVIFAIGLKPFDLNSR